MCMRGMLMEETGKFQDAVDLYRQAWDVASNEFEKFLAAWFIARLQPEATGRLMWYDTALQLGLSLDNEPVRAAFPPLHEYIAQCYRELGDVSHAREHQELALSSVSPPLDKGPFYHGTKADLQAGDLLNAGYMSNYQSELVMNHIYFTGLINGAGLAAALANGEGAERVYLVEPTGDFEDDPNVTNKKFPGNPTRSYRSLQPLKIIGEATEWQRQTPEQLQQWREKLKANKGGIIN